MTSQSRQLKESESFENEREKERKKERERVNIYKKEWKRVGPPFQQLKAQHCRIEESAPQ